MNVLSHGRPATARGVERIEFQIGETDDGTTLGLNIVIESPHPVTSEKERAALIARVGERIQRCRVSLGRQAQENWKPRKPLNITLRLSAPDSLTIKVSSTRLARSYGGTEQFLRDLGAMLEDRSWGFAVQIGSPS